MAAEFAEGDVYRLEAGQVVEDDLYVTAGEIFIDGRVEGDLVAAGGYIEVNGEVTGDLLAAGAGIVINGAIGDDVRAGGAGIKVNGTVGDDLFAAGGGSWPGAPTWPATVNGRTIEQGVLIANTAEVGGDVHVVGGKGDLGGTVGRNLSAAMGNIYFAANVAGDARLYGGQITVADNASVGGTLYYSADANAATIPPGVAPAIEQETQAAEARTEPSLTQRVLEWTIRLARGLLGLIVLGWLLLKLAPGFMASVTDEMTLRPWPVAGVGVIAAVAALPVAMVLVGLAWLFWGLFPGAAATFMLLFGILGVLWFISPAVTGYCLGRFLLRHQERQLVQLVIGTIIILVAARAAEWIPVAGGFVSWLILMGSFVFALGALIRSRRAGRATASALDVTPQI